MLSLVFLVGFPESGNWICLLVNKTEDFGNRCFYESDSENEHL